MSFIWGYDQEIFCEVVDFDECVMCFVEIELQCSLFVLLEWVWLLKVFDCLDEVLVLVDEVVCQVCMVGICKDVFCVCVFYVMIFQYCGVYVVVEQELVICVVEVEGQWWLLIVVFVYQYYGKNVYDVGDYEMVCDSFKQFLFLCCEFGVQDSEFEIVLFVIEVVECCCLLQFIVG